MGAIGFLSVAHTPCRRAGYPQPDQVRIRLSPGYALGLETCRPKQEGRQMGLLGGVPGRVAGGRGRSGARAGGFERSDRSGGLAVARNVALARRPLGMLPLSLRSFSMPLGARPSPPAPPAAL